VSCCRKRLFLEKNNTRKGENFPSFQVQVIHKPTEIY
jgi:hypothetical protein